MWLCHCLRLIELVAGYLNGVVDVKCRLDYILVNEEDLCCVSLKRGGLQEILASHLYYPLLSHMIPLIQYCRAFSLVINDG